MDVFALYFKCVVRCQLPWLEKKQGWAKWLTGIKSKAPRSCIQRSHLTYEHTVPLDIVHNSKMQTRQVHFPRIPERWEKTLTASPKQWIAPWPLTSILLFVVARVSFSCQLDISLESPRKGEPQLRNFLLRSAHGHLLECYLMEEDQARCGQCHS